MKLNRGNKTLIPEYHMHHLSINNRRAKISRFLMSEFLAAAKEYAKVSLEDAHARIYSVGKKIPFSSAYVKIDDAMDRVTHEDVKSPVNIPACRVSIVDGFAISGLSENFRIVGKSIAGRTRCPVVGFGEGVYVTTGGMVSDEVLCVVPIEQCTVADNSFTVSPHANMSRGSQIRFPGSDTLIDSVIIPRGTKIGSSEFGLLVACQVNSVCVYNTVSVGVLSTGSEIVSGSVGDANGAYLRSSLRALFGKSLSIVDLGVLDDSVEKFSNQLDSLVCDVLITTGGVSKGNSDFWKPCLEQTGYEVVFGQLDLKPGKPTTFATREKAAQSVFCLPGNPASCFVTFNLLVVPFLAQRVGMRNSDITTTPFPVSIQSISPIQPDFERPEFLRASLSIMANTGELRATISPEHQRSSRMASCANGVDCLVKIPRGESALTGEKLECFLLYNGGAMPPVVLPGTSHTTNPANVLHGNSHTTNPINVLPGTSHTTKPTTACKARAFDKLVDWLKNKTDVENIALMDLAGFCRNCLSKWLVSEDTSLTSAQNFVYGMDYSEWKNLHQKGPKIVHAHSHSTIQTHAHTQHTHTQNTIQTHAPMHVPTHVGQPCASSIGNTTTPVYVLTISDRAHKGVYSDVSGRAICDFFTRISGYWICQKKIVPDEIVDIQTEISSWVKSGKSGLIVTTGGTGIGRRDVTREAILPLLTKEATGLQHLLVSSFCVSNPLFSLSRPTIGTIENNLIISLPGRPEAVEHALNCLSAVIPKALESLNT